MNYTALLSKILVGAAALTGFVGCSSAGSSSTSTSQTGCDVSFSNVQAAGASLKTTSFHDDGAIELFWNAKLKHLDVLGGDVKESPIRAFELDLYGTPIVDGADVTLLAVDPTDALNPVPKMTFSTASAPQMTATGGTVHFAKASDSRLIFTVNGATMAVLDENQKVVPGGPTLTMAMTCNIPGTLDP